MTSDHNEHFPEFDVEIIGGQIRNKLNGIYLENEDKKPSLIEDVLKVVSYEQLGIFIFHGSLRKLKEKSDSIRKDQY